MSLRSKVWVTVGLLIASMAARAEYKEVWNPPEAARGAKHAGHTKAVAPHVKTTPAKSVASVKTNLKTKPKAKKPHGDVAVKTAHAASTKTAPAKPAEAAAQSRQVAATPAVQSGSGSTPRELPPILH